MKHKIGWFYLGMAIAWLGITIACSVLMFKGEQVDALVAFCPSALCTTLYIDKITKKEK